jgi:hypothetical protein
MSKRAFESAGGWERLGVARITSECKENAQKRRTHAGQRILLTRPRMGWWSAPGHAIVEGGFGMFKRRSRLARLGAAGST